jgi:hypothetical protein
LLSDHELEAFFHNGFVRLSGALAGAEIEDMLRRFWRVLGATAITQDRATWPAGYISGLQRIRRGDRTPAHCRLLLDALDQVFGPGAWADRPHWGQALATFPEAGPWRLSSGPWHLDHAYRQNGLISGVNVFLFVDDVLPNGGGTLVIDSSPGIVTAFVRDHPRLHGAKHGELNKRLMQAHPWLRALTDSSQDDATRQTLVDQAEIDIFGYPARIVELTGRAGDVVVCHPQLIHAPGMNATDRPRLMRVQRFYRPGYGPGARM